MRSLHLTSQLGSRGTKSKYTVAESRKGPVSPACDGKLTVSYGH